MAGQGKIDVSPLSHEFTAEGLTVDVEIYRIDGNDGWTLEVALDDDTSIVWTTPFPTDQSASDESVHTVNGHRPKSSLGSRWGTAAIH